VGGKHNGDVVAGPRLSDVPPPLRTWVLHRQLHPNVVEETVIEIQPRPTYWGHPHPTYWGHPHPTYWGHQMTCQMVGRSGAAPLNVLMDLGVHVWSGCA
jgi:hypothetical protein